MANRIQHKRSSIEGKRPDGSYLEPGEIALNTNAKDPGLFFEGNDGTTMKVGPAHVGKIPPYTEIGYGNGETWMNSATNNVNVWSAEADKWLQNIAVPHGGSLSVIYVGSSYPEATDDVANDGASRPFATINRAVIEIAKRSILSSRNDEPANNKYVIFVLPGINIVYNEPGIFSDDFKSEVEPFAAVDVIGPETYRKFNPESGGLILPRGCSVIGTDAAKTFIVPTSYPKWNREEFLLSPITVEDRSNIFNWTGNSRVSGVTFVDKNDDISITDISGELPEIATLTSLRPHGFRSLEINPNDDENLWYLAGDMVTLSYPNDVFLNNEGYTSISAGEYIVEPITPTTFHLRYVRDGEYVLRRNLPNAPSANTSPALWADLSINLTTHHRLSVVGYTTERDLEQFYTKIQHAYSGLVFGGVSDDAQVLPSETIIGTSLPQVAVSGIDRVENNEAKIDNCAILSEYGMGGVRIDGDNVSGLKSAAVFDTKFTLFQNDPDVYDVYYDGQWIPLKEATWRGTRITEDQVTDRLALNYLVNSVTSDNLRFFYTHDGDSPVPGSDTSSGLPLDTSDTRHAAIEALNSASIDCDSVSVLGAAVAFYSRSGSDIKIRDSQVELGIQSLRAEGFAGINTLGGAESVHQGFEIQGIRLPERVTKYQVESTKNHIRKYFNTSISYVSETSLQFLEPVDLSVIHPYTLKTGDVIWVESPKDGSMNCATLADPPISRDMKTIYVLAEDNDIFINARNPEDLVIPPFVRRFVDPRPPVRRDFALWVKNTDTKHQAPAPGSILRLSEDSGASIEPLLDPGNQLDPGANGGWNHTFKVTDCFTKEFGDDRNSAESINQTVKSNSGYYLTFNPLDSFAPWVETKSYAVGSYTTLDYKTYRTEVGQPNTSTLTPASVQSTWRRSVFFEHQIPVGESYNNSDDDYIVDYDPNSTYLRGLGYDSNSIKSPNPIDFDDGSGSLGLLDPDDSNFADSSKVSPDWTPTYIALRRFLELLGYANTELDPLLNPVLWKDRNVTVASLGYLDVTCGYAASVGNWPVEFNRPSTIWCESMLWDAPGHLNYSKGLPQYRKSQLSQELQRDCEISEVWGGRVVANWSDC